MGNVEKMMKIKDTIERLKLEKAKKLGILEDIKKKWKTEFGTDDVEEIKKKLNSLMEEQEKIGAKKEAIYEKISTMYDWEEIARSIR